MARKRDPVPKAASTVRLTAHDDSIIRKVQCKSAAWSRKLTDRSKVISFALEFVDTNLSTLDSQLMENVE